MITYTYYPELVLACFIVVFNASSSHDPDEEIAGVKCCFGDRACSTGFIVEHIYAKPGVYNVSKKY